MDVAEIAERVERIAAARRGGHAGSGVDRAALHAALVAERQVRAWLDASQVDLARRLAEQSSFAESELAESTRGSLNDAGKTLDRVATLEATPTLAAALDAGVITAGHVDVVTRCSKLLDERRRGELFERVDRLGDVAAVATVEEFRRRVRDEARRVDTDDGVARLERQRRATRLSTWVDGEGMWNLRGRFDPVTGVRLDARIRDAAETLFADAAPDTAPADPIERQSHLRALALPARHLRRARLQHRLRPLQAPPRRLVAPRRTHRPRQPAAVVQSPSRPRARRPLVPHAGCGP